MMIRSIWKPLYINKTNYLNSRIFFFFSKKMSLILKWNRNDYIFPDLINCSIKIYNGLNFKQIIIKEKMFFHKFGEFFLTRKKTVYVSKKKNK